MDDQAVKVEGLSELAAETNSEATDQSAVSYSFVNEAYNVQVYQ